MSFRLWTYFICIWCCDGIRKPSISNGGWETYPSDISVPPGPCNIPIRDSTLSQEEFLERFAFTEPFIVRDGANNDLFRALTGKYVFILVIILCILATAQLRICMPRDSLFFFFLLIFCICYFIINCTYSVSKKL